MSTPAGESKWISNERSREVVQQLRGRMDAIIVGSGTVRADDPLLTARPTNPADVKRKATRVVVDSLATISLESQLVKTAREVPVLIAVSAAADVEKCKELGGGGRGYFSVCRCDSCRAIRIAAGRAGAAEDDECAGGGRRSAIARRCLMHV